MSLMKNLRRQEIEVFGAKKVVRNKNKEANDKPIQKDNEEIKTKKPMTRKEK